VRAETAEFIRDLDDLSKLLKRVELEEELFSQDLTSAPPAFRELLVRLKSSIEPFALKRANYSMLVVVLYSSFERFVDRMVVRMVESLNEIIPTFDKLPDSIRRSHRKKTLDGLADETWLERQSDPNLARGLIENLHSCEARLQTYRLNSVAYARHTANHRVSSIAKTFQEVSVDNITREVANTEPFRSYINAESRQRGLFDESMGAVDDLAARRNDVAHGNTSELLTSQQLTEYVEFFRVLARSYVTLLRAQLTRYLVEHKGHRLGKPDEVHYKSVVVLDLEFLPPGTLLRRGDLVAMRPPSGDKQFESGQILNIRTSIGDVESVLAEAKLMAGIELDFRPRKGCTLFVISRDTPCPWVADNSPI